LSWQQIEAPTRWLHQIQKTEVEKRSEPKQASFKNKVLDQQLLADSILEFVLIRSSLPTQRCPIRFHFVFLCAAVGEGEEEEAMRLPSDVPRDHFAVYVGEWWRRFVVPIALLDRPEFRSLLRCAEEEFGFAGAGGALVLPYEEVAFHSLTFALACAR
jgi:SAUR family protein